MNIVVLDGYALNPGDLHWDSLHELGDVTIHDRTPASMIVERAKDAEIVLTNKTPLAAQTLDALPKLRYIGVMATGYNIIDTAAARSNGVTVTNIPDYGTYSVAQHTIALLMQLCSRVYEHALAVNDGAWTRSPDWCFTVAPLMELYGKRMGIIGHGKIGQTVGRIATSFGVQVLSIQRSHSPGQSLYGESYVSEETLLQQSDIISLHCPLTPTTTGIINKHTIAKMKDGVLLLNTSRGGLIQEADLAEALNAGKIAGAGLDVLSVEPPNGDNPLLTARNCLITPHIAWATREARARLLDTCIANIRAFVTGNPANVVNG